MTGGNFLLMTSAAAAMAVIFDLVSVDYLTNSSVDWCLT
jgi:hypothetical protein